MWWQKQSVERTIVAIAADETSVEQTLAVYAQFVVTQTLEIPRAARITELRVPLHEPAAGQELIIKLFEGDELVREWRHLTRAIDQMTRVSLPVEKDVGPGSFSVEFSAPGLQHASRELAPRLYVETAGSYYPEGNFRIANNQKDGDVGLRLMERVNRWTLQREAWRASPLQVVVDAGRWLMVLLLVMAVPIVLRPGVVS